MIEWERKRKAAGLSLVEAARRLRAHPLELAVIEATKATPPDDLMERMVRVYANAGGRQ